VDKYFPVIDTLLFIGIVANLVKGGDLVLRQHQKEWLQDRFETLTLWMDGIQPIAWFGALSRPRPAAIWSVFSAFFLFVTPIYALGGALAFFLDLWIMSAKNLSAGDIPTRVAFGVGLLVAVPISVATLWKVCPRLVQRLVGNGHGGWFFVRILILYFASAAIFFSFFSATRLTGEFPALRLALALLWPCLLPVFVLNAAAILLVSLLLFLWILRLLLALLKGICWRISEYDRGVFAAFLLLTTVALGVYRTVETVT